MPSALDNIADFQQALVTWYRRTAKDYPWRRTSDPWHILVSEVMLQQTQVATVLGKHFFTNFIATFPTPAAIANASEQEILSAWEGLGYYRRVRNLQKAAQAICSDHAGIFPRIHAEILALPGIGRYTAGAICSFAYDQAEPIVDANVARIFSRLFNYSERVDSTAGTKQLWHWAAELLDTNEVKAYNSALMELGQQVCLNKSPKCLECPIAQWCQATDPSALPVKKAAKKTVHLEEHCLFVVDTEQKKILLHQADASARRSGMWKLPERDPIDLESTPVLHQSHYAITHHKVKLVIYDRPKSSAKLLNPQPGEQWHPLSSLDALPMPSPFRKALNRLLKDHF